MKHAEGKFTCALQYATFHYRFLPTVLMHQMCVCLCVSEMALQPGVGESPAQLDTSDGSTGFHWNIYKILGSGHCQLRR